MKRSSINADNNDGYYEALVERQIKADKKCVTIRDPNSIPVGYIAVVNEMTGDCTLETFNRRSWQLQWPILQNIHDEDKNWSLVKKNKHVKATQAFQG